MLIVEVTWWEAGPSPGHHASCHVAFSGDGKVEVAAHVLASVSRPHWDEVRGRILAATNQREIATAYAGTPLGQLVARGEPLANLDAFLALHVLAPTASETPLVESFIPEVLASQYGGRIFSDARTPRNRLFVLATSVREDSTALLELYRSGRLHRVVYRRVPTASGPAAAEWTTFFVPFRAADLSLSGVSQAARDLADRISMAAELLEHRRR